MEKGILRGCLESPVICVVIGGAVALIAIFSGPNISWASALPAMLPTSQIPEQPATLVGPRADAPIPLYLRPAANQPNVGYGNNGDAVTVLEQLASFLPEADPSSAWNHIRLDKPPYTEGWVQGRFLAFFQD